MANDRAFDKSIFMQFLISNIWFEHKCHVEINVFNLNLNILTVFISDFSLLLGKDIYVSLKRIISLFNKKNS